ncbi:hypothetical protein [Gemmobacter denitrificans]|uniref:Uncharacterized protein n=1 Tax=Gemmobacter denitrificans TaxID=3123040 RepID=A0ABU8BUB0_9RHOB
MLGIFAESLMLAARLTPATSREQIARLRREDEEWMLSIRDRRRFLTEVR